MKYTFRPGLWVTLATLVVMTLCIELGLWQYNKAESKRALQIRLEKHLVEPPVALPETMTDLEAWRYRRVKFTGVYDARYQVLLDNQVENTVAGYHVLTPMQVEGGNSYVLVNRGWIPGSGGSQGTGDRRATGATGNRGRYRIATLKVFYPGSTARYHWKLAAGLAEHGYAALCQRRAICHTAVCRTS